MTRTKRRPLAPSDGITRLSLPCPWCGSTDCKLAGDAVFSKDQHTGEMYQRTVCSECGGGGDVVVSLDHERGRVYVQMSEHGMVFHNAYGSPQVIETKALQS